MDATKRKCYVVPQVIRVERWHKTEKLYALEHRRNELVTKCAEEWLRLFDLEKSEFWTRALPQELFDTMESYDRDAALAAALAYVQVHRPELLTEEARKLREL